MRPLLKVLAPALLERLSIWVASFWPDAVMIVATCGKASAASSGLLGVGATWLISGVSARFLLREVAFLSLLCNIL